MSSSSFRLAYNNPGTLIPSERGMVKRYSSIFSMAIFSFGCMASPLVPLRLPSNIKHDSSGPSCLPLPDGKLVVGYRLYLPQQLMAPGIKPFPLYGGPEMEFIQLVNDEGGKKVSFHLVQVQ